jgi:hypothetical protein
MQSANAGGNSRTKVPGRFKPNRITAMKILQNAEKAIQSELVSDQSLEAAVYPDRNHPELVLTDDDEPTEASTVLDVLAMDPNAFTNIGDRQRFDSTAKKYEHWRFTASRTAKISIREWDTYDTRLRALVLAHVRDSLRKRKTLTEEDRRFFIGDVNTSDSLSSTPHAKIKDTLAQLCIAHVREHFFICEDPSVETSAIEDICWRSLGMRSLPAAPAGNARASADYMKFQRAVTSYRQTMVRMREYINHTYIWFLHSVSSPTVQEEFKQIQKHFIQEKVKADSDHKFTAQALLNYIEQNYLMDNSARIKTLERRLERMIRYNTESLLSWFDRFSHPVTELEIAKGDVITDEDELKQIWKDTFARNINQRERATMRFHMEEQLGNPDADFSAEDQESVKSYLFGKFDNTILRKLIVSLPSCPPYKPDMDVKERNQAHFTQLELGEVNYQNPNLPTPFQPKRRRPQARKSTRTFLLGEDEGEDSENEYESQDSPMFLAPSSKRYKSQEQKQKKKLPQAQWCKNPGCIKRGTHMFHTTKECKFPPAKRDKYKHSNVLFRKSSQDSTPDLSQVKCWSCGELGHYKRDCPKVRNACNFLYNNPESRQVLHSLFLTEGEMDAATRVLTNLPNSRNCMRCLRTEAECQGTCLKTETADFLASAASVRQKLAKNPEVITMFQDAYTGNQSSSSSDTVVGPFSASNFMAYDEGRSTMDDDDGSNAPPDVSFDTVLAPNPQELHLTEEGDASDVSDMLDDADPDHFFTRCDHPPTDKLVPCSNIGIESSSSLYWHLHKNVQGKPAWQQPPCAYKTKAGKKGNVAVGLANMLIHSNDGKATWHKRRVYLDSCGSYPLISIAELHDVKDAAEYGMPPLRFTTLESKTSWYTKVGKASIKLENDTVVPFLAYAYGTSNSAAKEHFYLLDMSTLLDLNIDLHAHMLASREGKLISVRTVTARSPRWKAGGARRGTSKGSSFYAPHRRARTIAKQAKQLVTRCKEQTRWQTRLTNKLKAYVSARQSKAPHTKPDTGICSCPPRIVDSLSLEDYLTLQKDLQALTVGSPLQYEADSQLLLNTCCSPGPMPPSTEPEDSGI